MEKKKYFSARTGARAWAGAWAGVWAEATSTAGFKGE